MRYLKGFKKINFERSYLLKVGWERTIIKNVSFFVESNKFYDIYRDNEGNMNFSYLPFVGYRRVKDKVFIAWNIDGSMYSDKYRNLSQSLGDCLNMVCVDVYECNGFYIYELCFDSYFKPFTITNDTDMKELLTNNSIKLNNNLLWDYQKKPHALITGTTGYGKTYFLLYLLRVFKANNFDIRIIDPKRASLLRWGKASCFESVSEDEDILNILKSVKAEMDKRYSEASEIDVSLSLLQLKPLFLVFDEVSAFFGGAASDKVKKECDKYIREIILKGREAQVYIILTTQKPMAKDIGTEIRDQLGLRIALGRMTDSGYGMVFGTEYKDIVPRFSDRGQGLIYIEGTTLKPMNYKAPILENAWVVK